MILFTRKSTNGGLLINTTKASSKSKMLYLAKKLKHMGFPLEILQCLKLELIFFKYRFIGLHMVFLNYFFNGKFNDKLCWCYYNYLPTGMLVVDS